MHVFFFLSVTRLTPVNTHMTLPPLPPPPFMAMPIQWEEWTPFAKWAPLLERRVTAHGGLGGGVSIGDLVASFL